MSAESDDSAIRCERCSRPFNIGDDAFEQEDRVIEVEGNRVTEKTKKIIVCIHCSE